MVDVVLHRENVRTALGEKGVRYFDRCTRAAALFAMTSLGLAGLPAMFPVVGPAMVAAGVIGGASAGTSAALNGAEPPTVVEAAVLATIISAPAGALPAQSGSINALASGTGNLLGQFTQGGEVDFESATVSAAGSYTGSLAAAHLAATLIPSPIGQTVVVAAVQALYDLLYNSTREPARQVPVADGTARQQ